jgi:hypothetical protein
MFGTEFAIGNTNTGTADALVDKVDGVVGVVAAGCGSGIGYCSGGNSA